MGWQRGQVSLQYPYQDFPEAQIDLDTPGLVKFRVDEDATHVVPHSRVIEIILDDKAAT